VGVAFPVAQKREQIGHLDRVRHQERQVVPLPDNPMYGVPLFDFGLESIQISHINPVYQL
jgi:hypothetical protein